MSRLNRRQFLEQAAASPVKKNAHPEIDPIFDKYANKALPGAYKTTTTLNEYTGPWTGTQARHLLRRTMFGVKENNVTALQTMSMSDAVDFLLDNIPAAPAPPLNNYTDYGVPDITGIPGGQTWVDAFTGNGDVNATRQASLKVWWFGLLINQNLSIMEKMIFFWHNHFATQVYVVGQAQLSYRHQVLLRSKALGNFKDFVKSVTKDAAMLMYLNGAKNIKNAPDENYARELQELFTVGKNNPVNYTEDDVKAAARVLTGWQVNDISFESFFQPALHDTTDKQFSSFYGNSVIHGQGGSNGANETDELIELLFTKEQEIAHFICEKLYRFFVYYNIDASIDTNIIQPLATLFINNNFEIKPVLRALLKSEHFYDVSNSGCYIKTPLDFLVGTFRSFNINIPGTLTTKDRYAIWGYPYLFGDTLGLNLGEPPNVAGWQAFYKSPVFYEMWINSSTLPLRMEFGDMMLSTGYTSGTSTTIAIDILEYTKTISVAYNATALIQYLQSVHCGIDIAATDIDNLKNILLAGQANESYWTDVWNNYIADPSPENTNIVKNRLTPMYTYLLRLPECQLC